MGKFDELMFLRKLEKGDNVYLTDDYVVVQELQLKLEGRGKLSTYLISYDTYYVLNNARFNVYKSLFENAEDFSKGKRIKTWAYRRSYIN